jgi:hypothetical protein
LLDLESKKKVRAWCSSVTMVFVSASCTSLLGHRAAYSELEKKVAGIGPSSAIKLHIPGSTRIGYLLKLSLLEVFARHAKHIKDNPPLLSS